MKELKTYFKANGFTMVNGTLTEVVLSKVIIERKSYDDEDYSVTTIFQCPEGEEISTDADFKFYESVEDYEKGIIAKQSIKRNPFDIRPDGFMSLDDAWMFIDGEPQKIDIRPLRCEYDYSKVDWSCPGIPTKGIFETEVECLSFNEYDVKHSDGSLIKRVGVNKLVMLDEDQRKLLDNLKDAIEKIRKSKVLLLPDCDGNISAFNLRNVENWDCNYDGPEDESWEEVFRTHKEFDNEIIIPAYSEDCGLYVKRK